MELIFVIVVFVLLWIVSNVYEAHEKWNEILRLEALRNLGIDKSEK